MKINEIFANTSHTIIRKTDVQITKLVIDSRKATEGALFICLRGLNTDSHDFIGKAIEAGAAAVLVDDEFAKKEFALANIPANIGIVSTQNTRPIMAYLGANFYSHPAKSLRLIGVTGTNGKTTFTYFMEEILRKCGRQTGLIGTVGIRVNGEKLQTEFTTDTTPDPIELHQIFAQMMQMGVQDIVMEVSSHALALHKMEGLTFETGVFTNLTQDHLDFHGTMENYARAKAQLFTQSNHAVVNADDKYTPIMLENYKADTHTTYGIKTDAQIKAEQVNCTPKGSTFTLRGEEYKLPVRGEFNVYNTLAAIAAAEHLGCDPQKVKQAVAELSGVSGRIQSVPNERGLNIFIDYAHSPDGLENIIKTVREITSGKVITIFGCGGDRDKTKRPIMGEIADTLSDYCILTSDNPRTENPHEILAQIETGVKGDYTVIENRREAIFEGIKMLTPQDALIIAGKGHEDYQIIGTTKHHFDDFETATEALSLKGE